MWWWSTAAQSLSGPVAAQPLSGLVESQNNIRVPDGESHPVLQGKQSEIVTSQLHGKYYTQTYRGNVFWFTIANSSIPGLSPTPPQDIPFSLYNPVESGVNVVLFKYVLGYRSGNSLQGSNVSFAAYGIPNKANDVDLFNFTFTPSSGRNALLGGGRKNKAVVGDISLSSAVQNGETDIFTAGISETQTSAASSTNMMSLVVNFNGSMIVPPGILLYTKYTGITGATNNTFTQTLVWEEIQLP